MVILGAASGFSGGMLNPFTVGVAQTVAELPMFSGWGLRTIIYLFILTAAISTVMLYARKVKKDKSKSIVYELEKKKVILFKKSLINTLVRDKQLAYLL